jgi:deoxyribodipyrimidine photo-lyase
MPVIQSERVKALNDSRIRRGRYVLYWMQASQRAEYNHALEYAILQANDLGLPLVVFFGITDEFPGANKRHYFFMLEGLKEVKAALEARGATMLVLHRSPERGVVKIAQAAAMTVVDRGYLRIQREWRRFAAARIGCPLIQVESDVVVPVEVTSPKEEYAAATIRSKINTRIGEYLIPLKRGRVKRKLGGLDLDAFDIEDTPAAVERLKIDRNVGPVTGFRGGTSVAKRLLRGFIAKRLDDFDELRNDPTKAYTSDLSPYLHFGQVSPVYIGLKIREARSTGTAAYLEELIVRRELSMNFVYYNPDYDSYRAIPGWAKKTLAKHRNDRREYVYTLNEFENAMTHDPYWNAAQDEMRLKGKMHGYMRMYWGKKILEWARTPQHAFRIALHLNNKYELDGRDPNGFTGVAWCFGKHDRPWGEREIFGQVRYMNDKGLRRKFDADAYVDKVDKLRRKSKQNGGM